MLCRSFKAFQQGPVNRVEGLQRESGDKNLTKVSGYMCVPTRASANNSSVSSEDK